MRWREGLLLLPPSLALASFSDVIPTDNCPILGPVYPSGFDLTKSKAIQAAKEKFPTVIESMISSGEIFANLSSFTVDVYSTSTNESFYSYSHEAPVLNGTLTAGVLNDETIFRIGSVTKLYTVYAIILQAGIQVFDHPVTEYLPELAGNSREDILTKIIWEDVTVGALAAQQGGSGGPPIKIADCFDKGNCSVESTLAIMKDHRPVIPPFRTPQYSDAGYFVLGRVLERLSGMPYEEAVHNILSIPLGLKSTSTTLPTGDDLNMLAITKQPTAWAYDNQMTASSGGIYANNADLRTLGLSILNNELLTPAITRQWMKPRGHTSSLTFSVGAPWEISRVTIPVTAGSKRTRVSDLYTKGGGNPPYGTVMGVSPDHGIGFSLQVAGETSGSDRWALRDAVAETFMPAAELAAEEYTAQNFVGTFVDEATDDTNITLTMDEGMPGLRVESFFIDGINWRYNLSGPAAPTNVPITVRIYPSGLVGPLPSVKDTTGMVFNAVPYAQPPDPRAAIEGGEGLFDKACTAWFIAGFNYIGGHAMEQFMLHVKDGKLNGIEYGFMGVTMKRVE